MHNFVYTNVLLILKTMTVFFSIILKKNKACNKFLLKTDGQIKILYIIKNAVLIVDNYIYNRVFYNVSNRALGY